MSTRTLDYGETEPFSGVIGRSRHLAWPVDAYRITIPAALGSGEDRLNPFERVILTVIDSSGGQDEESLSQETCIPVDLVRSVVLRLRDRGLINEDNRIIDSGRRTWEQENREESYTTALAFRELVGGRLLPFVQLLDDRNPLKTKVVDRLDWTMPQDHASSRHSQPSRPSPRDIIAAINQMKRRSESYARATRTPAIEQIRVSSEPEQYVLDCLIAIQSHDADFRIADPFGTGFSRVLEEVFALRLETDEKLQRWMMDWRKKLSSSKVRDYPESRPRKSFDTEECRRSYPKLVKALEPARGAQHRSVEDIYASLEWALFYTCEMRNPQLAILRLKLEIGSDYSDRLADIAEGLGFEVSKFGFRPLPSGKFDDYLKQKPEMQTVLAIALFQAEDDHEHPLRRIARNHPDFIRRLRTLASDRGDRAHGQRGTGAAESELQSDSFMRETISALLPSVRFSDSKAVSSDAGAQIDLRLEARTNLLYAFGYPAFNKLGLSTQASLLDAEKFWLACTDGDDARSFVGHLYATLQGVLRQFLRGAPTVDVPEGDYREQAGVKAHLAGLGPLPNELESVNPWRIRETLQGNDLSVGASVVAFLLTAGDQALIELACSQPDFLSVVAAVINKRGHLNQPVPMQKADVGQFRKSTIKTVRTMLELTQEG